VRQEPATHGLARARWRLADVRAAAPALAGYTLGGVSRALRRLGVRLKRGRLRLHGPDPAYADKVARIGRARALARAHPTRVALYDGDEVSCHRQPTLAGRWFPRGEEPTAALSHRANTRHRVAGALEAATGRVVRVAGSKTGVAKLRQFLRALRAADPDRYLFLVWDNWPVHAHPEVLAEAARLRIRLLWLPTYAPWENPIEKLWRLLKQTVLHHHARADDWEGLKAAIAAFLDRFEHGSTDLLRYVGLLPK
jgi:transposase